MNFFENLKKINLIHSQPQNRTLWFDGAHHPSNHADEQWPLSIPLRETAGFSLRSFILKNKAMSLTEVLLAVAVLGLLMASLLGAFVMGVKFLEKEEAKTDILANNAALIFNTIERDLREAVMITIAEEKTVEFISCPDSVPGLDTKTAALWHFNEGSGLAYDETANHNDGTIYQAIRTTAGEDNRGLDFDGVDDYVSCQDSLSLNLTAKLSIEAWIQPDSTGAIIYKEGAYYLIINSDGKLEGAIYYAAGWHSITTAVTDAVLLDGQTWTNVAMVYDKDAEGTEELKLYINGRIVGTGNHSNQVEASNNVLFIGKDELGNSPFDGRIDEVRISNIARDFKIKFFWSGIRFSQTGDPVDKLSKVVEEGTYQLEEGYVQAFTLKYYDDDGNELVPLGGTDDQSERDKIEIVNVSLTLENKGQEVSLDNRIHLRN